MQIQNGILRLLVTTCVVAVLSWDAVAQNAGTPTTVPDSPTALVVDGADLLDADGNVVAVRAINVGNWFLLEPWMFGQGLRDEATLLGILTSRFGQPQADALIEMHRDGWMTQRDFDAIADAGFNAIRLPFHFRLVESEPFVLDEVGVQRLQDAMDMADQAGLYVILDMHAVPGGQSLDGPSGDATQNEIWTDEEAQRRFVWLWQALARRYKNQSNFIAYDLMNEPFGDFSTDISGELISIMDRAIAAVRVVDPNRLIYVPAPLQGIRIYGNPADRGWVNVGLTDHQYPGIFDGQEATLGNLSRFTTGYMRDLADYSRGLGVPFLLGEFNPVYDRQGAPEAVRQIFDVAEQLGIQAAVWSYKIIKPSGGVGSDNWYFTTNRDNLTFSNVETASYQALEQTFSNLGTMPLANDFGYFASLISPLPADVLPAVDELPLVAPAADTWPLWTVQDIGSASRIGGQAVVGGESLGADSLTLYSAGQDLFGSADSFRLAARSMPPTFTVSGVLDAFRGGRFAQAGVTVRESNDPSSPHVSIVAFPDGRVVAKVRGGFGQGTSQQYLTTAGFPVGLGLERSSGGYTAWVTDDNGEWQPFNIFASPNIGSSPLGGFFALANRDGPLTEATFTDPSIEFPPMLAIQPTLDIGVNLAANPSFEQGTGNEGPADDWTLTGNMSRQVGWTPTRDGNALLAYRHWESGSNPSEARAVLTGLTPGKSYEWTVYANRDTVSGGQRPAEAVELRVESAAGPTRWLESVRFNASEIAIGDDWSRLQVRFVATAPSHVVKLIAYPASSGNRDGALKFDTFVISEKDAP